MSHISNRNSPGRLPRLALIGQCINPAGRTDVEQALRAGDWDALAALACAQYEAGAEYVDLCAGLPGLDEGRALRELLEAMDAACPGAVPVLDSPDPGALERALRGWKKAVVLNSTTAESDKLDRMLTLAGEHDAQIIALAMFGRPGGLDERLRALETIVGRAESLGLPRERIIADCLALAECAQPGQACVTLDALTAARAQFGLRTVIGVSNVSGGLPGRSVLNGAFLAMAVARGLDFAIVNPLDCALMDEVHALALLTGWDESAMEYILHMRSRADGLK